MGCLEGINRRSARPKPLSSLPTADTACTTRKSQIPVKMTFSEPENFQNHEKYNVGVFQCVVGSLFLDTFRRLRRPLHVD